MAHLTPDAASSAVTGASTTHRKRRRSNNKRHSDPFLALPDDAAKLSEPGKIHQADDSDENGTGRSHPLLADLVLTPLHMMSFILSLSLVDRQQRQWRLSQHSSAPKSFWSRLASRDSEPYQDSRDSTWQRSSSSADQGAPLGMFPGWYTQKKHRAMAKLELNDAFEMRGRVMIALISWLVLGMFAVAYTMRQLFAWISK